MAQVPSGTIAGEAELEAFQKAPDAEKQFTPQLRGVLAETAVTGRIRYQWALVRPLMAFVLEKVLKEFEESNKVEVGPPRPLPHGESVAALCDRLRGYLWEFSAAPWTSQRFCELLLEPRKQYNNLHKLAAALEKLLLVTSELLPDTDLPPPPLLSELTDVNATPAHVAPGDVPSAPRRTREDEEAAGLPSVALRIHGIPPGASSASVGLRSDSQPQHPPAPQPPSEVHSASGSSSGVASGVGAADGGWQAGNQIAPSSSSSMGPDAQVVSTDNPEGKAVHADADLSVSLPDGPAAWPVGVGASPMDVDEHEAGVKTPGRVVGEGSVIGGETPASLPNGSLAEPPQPPQPPPQHGVVSVTT